MLFGIKTSCSGKLLKKAYSKGGNGIFTIVIRTIIIYVFLLLSMRLSGKRQVGELQLSELITAFLISEVATTPLTDPDMPILYALIPITVLLCLEITVSFITTKSVSVKRMFEPAPTVLIGNGKLNIAELKKQRLTADELISSLRLNNVSDINTVNFCFLEHNGQISSFSKDETLALPLIVDGKIHNGHLKLLGRDENWLKARLREQKADMNEVFIAVSDGNTLTIFAKEKRK